ncbi:hypothetical protein EYF80_055123 [Liparis tanakae]|uniref:Uncharacterized protein n=1 Tax=Liparis tanakae TaxID=230148 RepID=A0A4Z2F1S2_9TELE|nr:hypothetical protein EYF80_055123 [Liparis tanakae]
MKMRKTMVQVAFGSFAAFQRSTCFRGRSAVSWSRGLRERVKDRRTSPPLRLLRQIRLKEERNGEMSLRPDSVQLVGSTWRSRGEEQRGGAEERSRGEEQRRGAEERSRREEQRRGEGRSRGEE